MNRSLICHSVGPGVTIQDLGRAGTLALGLSRGGAADRRALYEGAALLGQAASCAALELNSMGGVFEVTEDTRIALTGAPMKASIGDQACAWNASYLLPAGARLNIGAVTRGCYGYLHLGGGLAEPMRLGARSAHLVAGIGRPVAAGDRLAIGEDTQTGVGLGLSVADRFTGGDVRVTASLQTDLFGKDTLDRFENTEFTRDARANRMGVKMTSDGAGFLVQGGLQVLSEIIVPGDIQVTGDGTPFVLIAESQTTGGYPRIATVIPPDLPRVAQAPAGSKVTFNFVSLDDAIAAQRMDVADLADLPSRVNPRVRDPKDIKNLAEYQLISGATSGVTEGEGSMP